MIFLELTFERELNEPELHVWDAIDPEGAHLYDSERIKWRTLWHWTGNAADRNNSNSLVCPCVQLKFLKLLTSGELFQLFEYL